MSPKIQKIRRIGRRIRALYHKCEVCDQKCTEIFRVYRNPTTVQYVCRTCFENEGNPVV
jgi:hypothetical protein